MNASMPKTSRSAAVLPVLGVILALVLAGATIFLSLQPAAPASDSRALLGRLIALVQGARADGEDLLTADAQHYSQLARTRAEIDMLRQQIERAPRLPEASRALVTDVAGWNRLTSALDTILDSRALLTSVGEARATLDELLPDLLAMTGNLASDLPLDALSANQSQLARFEVTVEQMQLALAGLGSRPPGEVARRLGDAEQYLSQVIRGLSGQDGALGLVPLPPGVGAERLNRVEELFGRIRDALGVVVAAADPLAQVVAANTDYEAVAGDLLERYRDFESTPTVAGQSDRARTVGLVLLGVALALLLLMMAAYHRARDFQRAANMHAVQNERNQQAILRLLDELSSLADGDLTVQATVTEDITGAIADSINYAIEALRELVTTIHDTSILVDAAAKQTEETARQLVRASETQSKQAADASESINQMAISIEEVSGNAERCSDVARHAVAVAHKGGAAVRRTIDGMNTIRETIQDTSKRIKRLGESSQEIGNIVELIEEIAEQTNILALNASIEASRAGEASRGFAVVADEVQKLAERSANATRKIEMLVSTIQSDTHETIVSMERSTTDVVGGALLAENAGAALEEIEQVSHQIASLVQNISGSAREQTGVSSALTKNMQVLREVSAKAMDSTMATQNAISKLSELASQLRGTVSGFRLPDHVTGTGVLSHARVAESLRRAGQELAVPGEDQVDAPPRQRKSG